MEMQSSLLTTISLSVEQACSKSIVIVSPETSVIYLIYRKYQILIYADVHKLIDAHKLTGYCRLTIDYTKVRQ